MPYEKLKLEFYKNVGGLNQKASEYITGTNQVLNLINFTYERPGAFISRPGQEVWASLATSTYGALPSGLYEYGNLLGTTQIIFDSGSTLYALGAGAIAQSLTPGATISYPIDFETANYILYYANGYAFQTYTQTISTFYSIPQQNQFVTLSAGADRRPSASFLTGVGRGVSSILASGQYSFKFAFVKYESPLTQVVGEALPDSSTLPLAQVNISLSTTLVGRGVWNVYGLTVPQGYGIQYVIPYMKTPLTTDFLKGPITFLQAIGFGTGFEFDNFVQTTDYDQTPFFTLIPRFLASYKNMLFMAGFSSQPSVVWHSEIAQAENVQLENFFEVRTSNGDEITGLQIFQDTLIAFKYNSIHEINGDSPDSLSLKDTTLEYGCVNNEASVVFENKLWFVDQKGVCEYAGANTFIVSTPVEDTFRTLNPNVAKALHVKARQEVWFCFGGTCLVYDYSSDVWTTYTNVNIQAGVGAAVLNYSQTRQDVSYFRQGTSFYNLARFGDSLTSDFGNNITLVVQTPYYKRDGDTTQEMWRRLYVDANANASTVATVNFRPDYGPTVVLSRGLSLSTFQTRIDYGISARSLSVELIVRSTNQVLINGYALEARYLRSV